MKEVRRANKVQAQDSSNSFTIKRGNTTYTVGVHFSEKCNATLEDRLKQLLYQEEKD